MRDFIVCYINLKLLNFMAFSYKLFYLNILWSNVKKFSLYPTDESEKL